MSPITTHVLDSSAGGPAAGVPVTLEHWSPSNGWSPLGQGRTDIEGRVRDLLPDDHVLQPGLYQLLFDTSARSGFFPAVVVRFRVEDPRQHFHLPLLLSPFSFTTYRGS
jgi:5-hydroxyisourate hydrolase